jgi:hypothetical protein
LVQLLERTARRAQASLDVLHRRFLGSEADRILCRVDSAPTTAVRLLSTGALLRKQIFVYVGQEVPVPCQQLLVRVFAAPRVQ